LEGARRALARHGLSVGGGGDENISADSSSAARLKADRRSISPGDAEAGATASPVE
jgi:hypothetical protein